MKTFGWYHKNHQRIKREVRCKSGAIPVAVSFYTVGSSYHCFIREGVQREASQKTCHLQHYHELSGERPEMRESYCRHFHFYLFHFTGAYSSNTLNIQKNEHETNSIRICCLCYSTKNVRTKRFSTKHFR